MVGIIMDIAQIALNIVTIALILKMRQKED